jgi:phosphatidyl-myo-inositol dimannoside synthase
MHASEPSSAPIFLITHEFYPRRGGIATFTEEMAKASAKLGYEVEVWAQTAPKHREKSWPFRLRRLPLKGSHDLSCQLRLVKELIAQRRRLRYATVYLPEPGPMLAMMFLQFIRTFRPKRLVLTFHGSEILRFYHNPLYRILTRRLIRNAHRISTLTRYTQSLLCHHFPEAEDKVFLTPGALRSDFAIVNSQLNPEKDRIVILTVGRLHPRKGQLETLKALQALAPQFRNKIEYWIVGTQGKGSYAEQLRACVASSDLKVRFFGDVTDEELDTIYDRADIFAMTSIDHGHSVEGFGLVYLEAAAHGLPVVGHSIGGVDEAVINGETGLLVPPNRPAQLTAAFEKLITDPQYRQQLGQSGQLWARRSHWAHSAATLFTEQPAAEIEGI